jgi:hypothetical protein
MRAEPKSQALHVTTQYFRGEVRICELEVAGALLDVFISKNGPPGSNTAWRIEARDSRADGAVSIAESSATRAEALLAVARAWAERGPALGLRGFDWLAVGNVLKSVSAI